MSTRKRPAVELPKDWEDEYHRLKDKYEQLKIDYNEKDNHNKMLQAKVRKMESDILRLDQQLGGGKVAPSTAEKEERDLVSDLTEELQRYRIQNMNLSKKVEQLNDVIEKKKKEVASLRKTNTMQKALSSSHHKNATGGGDDPDMELEIKPGRNPTIRTPQTPALKGPATPTPAPTTILQSLPDVNMIELAKKYKSRINSLENELHQLKDDNEKLKLLHASHNAHFSKTNPSPVPPPNIASTTKNIELESTLRDTTWKLQQLQVQYDYLVSKQSSQTEAGKHNELQLEDAQHKMRELRRVCEELRHEKEMNDMKVARIPSLEDQISELKQANASLEEKITRLCEAPFINDAFGQHEMRIQYQELIKEKEQLSFQVEHLQEAVRTHFSALNTLKGQAAQLRGEKDEAHKKLEELTLQMKDMEKGTSTLQDQLRMYTGDDGIDLESLEKALTMVKRRDVALEHLSFLENPDGANLSDADYMVTIPMMKKKIQEHQLTNLRMIQENERLDHMLKIQTNINQDLNKEIQSLVLSKTKDTVEYKDKITTLESLALSRLNKMHALEAQLKQFIYGLSKQVKNKGPNGVNKFISGGFMSDGLLEEKEGYDTNSMIEPEHQVFLLDLLKDPDGNIQPYENVLEVWVKEAKINQGVVTAGSSTFVVMDFFDYESQTTSILTGTSPQWDFGATYKLHIDDFLLRYLATDYLTLELNMASQGDFSLIARCSIPLNQLLKTRPKISLSHYPLISPRSNTIVAYITVEIQLALPISELYRLFLERHPQEKQYINELLSKRLLETTAVATVPGANPSTAFPLPSVGPITVAETLMQQKQEESRLYNELEVVIHQITELPTGRYQKQLPSAYVHFQLLGNPDKFTNPIFNSNNPQFQEKFTFPMITNDQSMRLLSRQTLMLSVMNMDVDEGGKTARGEDEGFADEDGMIGEVKVGLSDLTYQQMISDSYFIVNKHGKKMGNLFVTFKWKYPLRKERELGPNVITGMETEILINAFSFGLENIPGGTEQKNKDGVIDYIAFCKYITLHPDLLKAKDKFVTYLNQKVEEKNISYLDALQAILPSTISGVNRDSATTPRQTAPKEYVQQFITKDLFVQQCLKHMSTSINSTAMVMLPFDYELLFDWLDTRDEGRISIAQLIAMLNLDEKFGISSILMKKLLLRVEELALSRGIKPVKLFEASDISGPNGLVTRLEFKKVLKQMGFVLIDEPDGLQQQDVFVPQKKNDPTDINGKKGTPFDEGLIDDEDQRELLVHQQEVNEFMKQQREIFEQKKAQLQQQQQQQSIPVTTPHEGIPPTGHVSSKMMPSVAIAPTALTGGIAGGRGGDGIAMDVSYTHPREDSLMQTNESMIDDGENTRVSISRAGPSNRPIALDEKVTHQLATKLQSRYRGYSARKQLTETTPQKNPSSSANPSMVGYDNNTIVEVEETITAQLADLPLNQRKLSLYDGFKKVDIQLTGFVNRQQFAHVLSHSTTAFTLYGAMLRQCMNFFDLQYDGNKLYYPAFIALLQSISFTPLTTMMEKLQQMIITKQGYDIFRIQDKQGIGYLSRADMLSCLAKVGYGYISQSILLSILACFETNTRQDGLIHYNNFFQYLQETSLSKEFQKSIRAWYDYLMNIGAVVREKATMVGNNHGQQQQQGVQEHMLRQLFSQIDSNRQGFFTYKEFVSYLSNTTIPTAEVAKAKASSGIAADGSSISWNLIDHMSTKKEVLYALYNEIDLDQTGKVTYPLLLAWILKYPEQDNFIKSYQTSGSAGMATNGNKDISTSFVTITVEQIRKKTYSYLTLAQQQNTLEKIMNIFQIYDWRRSKTSSKQHGGTNKQKQQEEGCLERSIFVFVLKKKCEFPYTDNEITLLCTYFAMVNQTSLISYARFLEWGLANINDIRASGGTNVTASGSTKLYHNSTLIINFIEKHISRNIDVLSVFARYDTVGRNVITLAEFSAAVNDLGLSNVTEVEVLDMAERLSVKVGKDMIAYRKLIGEILQRMDEKEDAEQDQIRNKNPEAAKVKPIELVVQAMKRAQVEGLAILRQCEAMDRRGMRKLHVDDIYAIFEDLQIPVRRQDLTDFVVPFVHISDSGAGPKLIAYPAMLKALEQSYNAVTKLQPTNTLTAIYKQVSKTMESKLKAFFETLILQGMNYREEFDKFDNHFTGGILFNDYMNVMKDVLACNLFTDHELITISSLFRSDADTHRMNYVRFLYVFHPRTMILTAHPNDIDSQWEQDFQCKVYELADELRRKIRRKTYEYHIIGELHKAYRHFTRKKDLSVNVTLEDFSKAIQYLGMRYSADEEKGIFDLISNYNPDLQFAYQDFVIFICDPQFKDLIWKLRRFIARLNISEQNLIKQLSKLDSNESGVLTAKQFRRALHSLGLESFSDSDILRLMVKFDLDESQRLDINSFMKFMQGKSTSRSANGRLLDGGDNAVSMPDDNMNQDFSRCWNMLQHRIQEKVMLGYTKNEIYNLFDRYDRERLDIKSLQDGCKELGLFFTSPEMNSILRRMTGISRTGVNKTNFFQILDIQFPSENEMKKRIEFSAEPQKIEYKEVLDLVGQTPKDEPPQINIRLKAETDEIIDTIRRRLESYLGPGINSARKIKEVFEDMDRNKNGKIDRRELREAMAVLKVDLRSSEVDLLFERFDRNRSNSIDYNEFMDMLGYKQGGIRDDGRISSRLKAETDEIIDSIRRRLESYLGPGINSARKIKEIFEDMDRDRNGKIDRRELTEAMKVLKVDLRSQELDLLFERFDRNRSNSIDYNEFMDMLGYKQGGVSTTTDRDDGRISSRLKAETDEIIDTIRRRLESYLGPGINTARKIKEVFEDMDRNKNGKIDRRELKESMAVLKVDLRPSEIDLLFDRFDRNQSNSIDYIEFMDMLGYKQGGSSYNDRDKDDGRISSRLKAETDEIIDSIRRRLESYLGPGINSARKIKEIFEDMDRDRNGKIDRRELTEAMKVLKVDLRSQELDLLFERFDRNRSNSIDYNEFMDMLGYKQGGVSTTTDRDDGRISSRLKAETDEIIDTIRRRLESYLGPGINTARKIKEIFEDMDRDRNGKIDRRELMEAMKVLKVDLRSSEVDLLFERFDRNRSNSIDYNEFMDMLGYKQGGSSYNDRDKDKERDDGRISSRLKAETDEIIDSIRRRLESYLGPGINSARKIKEIFEDMDRDRNGKIDRRELTEAMKVLKVDLRSSEIDLLFERFDRNRSNSIDYNEFMDMLGYKQGGSSYNDRDKDKERDDGRISSRLKAETDEIIDSIRRRLESYLGPGINSARKIKEIFEDMDRDRNGKIDRRELTEAMKVLKVDLRSQELDLLFERFDRNRSNSIDYNEFMDMLGYKQGGVSSSTVGRDGDDGRISSRLKAETDEIIDSIRRQLESYLGPGINSARKIKEIFEDMDRDRNGKIDRRELTEAMKVLKVDLRSQELDLLFERFDRNRSNSIDYNEFMDMLGYKQGGVSTTTDRDDGRISSRLKAETDEIIDTIRRRLESYLGPGINTARKIKEIFEDMDRDRNGKIDRRELMEAMKVLKVDLRSSEVDLLFERFDRNRSNSIDYNEFMDMLGYKQGGVSSSMERVDRSSRFAESK